MPAKQLLSAVVLAGNAAGHALRGSLEIPTNSRRVMAVDDVRLEFVGLENNERREWTLAGEHYRPMRVLRRPSWQRTTRCESDHSESCQECWGEDDCFTGMDASRVVVSRELRWRRLVNSIHVRCNPEHFSIHYALSELRNGTVRLLWDGLEFAQHKSAATGLVDSSDLHIETEGGHTLEVEFWPAGEDSSAVFSALELQMPESFAECQDFKVCLDPLHAHDAASKRLRNSNELQLQCLEEELDDDFMRNTCELWRGCLSLDMQVGLLGLLRAAVLGEPHAVHAGTNTSVAVGTSQVSGIHRRLLQSSTTAPNAANAGPSTGPSTGPSSLTQATSGATTTAAGTGPSTGPSAGPSAGPNAGPSDLTRAGAFATTTMGPSKDSSTEPSTEPEQTGFESQSGPAPWAADCVDPELADAESWNCDCLAEMQWACLRLSSESFSEATCLRAQMCSHDRVCEHWKTAAGCFSGELLDAQLQLEGMRRLNDRASSAQEANSALDRALLAKNCQ